jgi:predicted SpoU family rRNA methylase
VKAPKISRIGLAARALGAEEAVIFPKKTYGTIDTVVGKNGNSDYALEEEVVQQYRCLVAVIDNAFAQSARKVYLSRRRLHVRVARKMIDESKLCYLVLYLRRKLVLLFYVVKKCRSIQ